MKTDSFAHDARYVQLREGEAEPILQELRDAGFEMERATIERRR